MTGKPRGRPFRKESAAAWPPTQLGLVHAVVAAGVRDPRLIQALHEVGRAEFVPPDLAEQAYLDEPLPIPHGLVTTQPSLLVKMVEALGLMGSEKVLEIGTGYGFQTALLARLSRFVWSLELWPDIAETGRRNLARAGITNAAVITGDGTEGLPEHAPFDAILVSAASVKVPRPLVEQLAIGGRLVQPMGPGGAEDVVLFVKDHQGLTRRQTITPASFVKLRGKHAAG